MVYPRTLIEYRNERYFTVIFISSIAGRGKLIRFGIPHEIFVFTGLGLL
jgi:hypothetical protein